jgi:hypothetical protein
MPAHDFNIRQFFRRAPRQYLRRHFEERGAPLKLDLSQVKARNVQPLVDAFECLPEDTQARMQDEFAEIITLATPAGKVQILDEATFHGKQQRIVAEFETLNGIFECVYWTFFEHHDCWKGAVRFAESDGKRRSWRMRANMPRLGRAATSVDGRALAAAVTKLFRQKEARGEHCVVEQFRRGGKEYYFAYAQDHRQISLEYAGGRMTNRPHRPAFEIIFIHDDIRRTLRVWHQGRKERVQDLQVAFALAVLGRAIPARSPPDLRVYDLGPFLNPDFTFRPSPQLGIKQAVVREMDVRVAGPSGFKFDMKLDALTPSHVLYSLLGPLLQIIRPTLVQVTRARLQVEFEPNRDGDRLEPCTFDLRVPNACSLQDDAAGILIQRMLEDHGIEPRQPAHEKADVGSLL